ncbi:MAG: TonB-dependent receptor family protein [Steroidobacterales bacterium]
MPKGFMVGVRVSLVCACVALCLPGRQSSAADADLSPVVVTATRVAERSYDLPVAVDRVGTDQIHAGQFQVNLSEVLDQVPGASVQNRQNYAQDLQISIRGFGARSSFGVRGVRLYSDGIPGTMPDGQGQFSQFDLGSAAFIEVLRGPFSALYGNSSGGVIAEFTADAAPGTLVEGTADYGTFGTARYALKAEGDAGVLNYVVDAAHFQTDGYRDHSAAERDNFNSKVRIVLDDASRMTFVANVVSTPFVQDPLGLTQAQLGADPDQAGSGALQYDTRKSLGQQQVGAIYERRLSATDDLVSTLYGGHRTTVQYQAIPASTEVLATNPGGVIDLERYFAGIDLHVTDHREVAGTALQVTAGINYDDLEEARKGYLNFVGAEDGVEGTLRRSQANRVYDLDQYLQAQWDPGARWRLLAGVRNNVVDVMSHNYQAAAGTDADSGVRYTAVDPVAGVTFRAASQVNLYASYGKGFETPTLNDLAYRSTNGSLPGLNLGLLPARSDNYELGIKTEGAKFRADLDAFYIQTQDELAVLANAGGRTVQHNIGETQRRGIELALDSQLGAGFSARLAYTYIRAVTGQAYKTCVSPPCTLSSTALATVPAGSYLPAVPMNALYAGITWQAPARGFTATLETQARAQIYADDRNIAAASGYWALNLRFGWVQERTGWRLTEFVRVDNLADRAYVGSVIVNESNSRYFESEPGRTFAILFTAARRSLPH